MTPRERILAPLRKIKPDRPAWLADLNYWYAAKQIKKELDPKYEGLDGFKKLHEDLGVCCYYGHGSRIYHTFYDGVEINEKAVSNEKIRQWKTPKGELTEKWVFMEKSYCWAQVEYAVKDIKDLKIVKDIFSKIRIEPSYHEFLEMSELLGDSGLPISPLPRSPLPALLTDWCGVVNTIFLFSDYSDEVLETLNVIEKANSDAFTIACESPVELFHFCDNLDSSNSTSFFEYMENYYNKHLMQLHQNNKMAVVHLDGAVRGLLPKLAACGFDGIEAITPYPVGDVKVEELPILRGDNAPVIWGGIPGAMFCDPWTAESIKEQTLLVLKTLAESGRLIIGSADQIPPDGDINLCKVVAETIETASLI